VELEGSITAFTSKTSFSVNGIPVDATNAVFGDGALALGVKVEVKGSAVNGVVSRHPRLGRGRGRGITPKGFELHGAIASIDTVAKTFVLREVKVSYAGPGIDYRGGSEAVSRSA
jgi:hypothetical protein